MKCICGKHIEYVEGFGWRDDKGGYICWREGAGRVMAEAHEPYKEA